MVTYWIRCPVELETKLRGMGIRFGQRVGEHFERCVIPPHAEAALLDMWGPVQFDRDDIPEPRSACFERIMRRMRGEPAEVKRKPARRIR